MKRTANQPAFLAALLFAGAPGAVGCRPDFAPFNRLTSLRVMAVQSEPPSPAPGETAALSALVYTLPGDPAPTYSWSWCPFAGAANEGHPCAFNGAPLDDTMLATVLAAGRAKLSLPPGNPPPALDLGSAPTAQLTNAIEPELLAAICAGGVMGLPPIDCANGFPFQIHLRVQTAGSHADQVDTVVTGHWRFDPASPANANPAIESLTATLAGTKQQLADQPPLTLPRDAQTPIAATVLPEAAETYAGLDENGVPAELHERLFITWFVETGDTEYARTSFIYDRTSFADLQTNKWAPARKKDYGPDTARLFVVIHDNRGGVSWQDGIVNLEPTP